MPPYVLQPSTKSPLPTNPQGKPASDLTSADYIITNSQNTLKKPPPVYYSHIKGGRDEHNLSRVVVEIYRKEGGSIEGQNLMYPPMRG